MPNWPAKNCAYPMSDRLAKAMVPHTQLAGQEPCYTVLIGWLSLMVLYPQLAGQEL
jgi:hypothetical protein